MNKNSLQIIFLFLFLIPSLGWSITPQEYILIRNAIFANLVSTTDPRREEIQNELSNILGESEYQEWGLMNAAGAKQDKCPERLGAIMNNLISGTQDSKGITFIFAHPTQMGEFSFSEEVWTGGGNWRLPDDSGVRLHETYSYAITYNSSNPDAGMFQINRNVEKDLNNGTMRYFKSRLDIMSYGSSPIDLGYSVSPNTASQLHMGSSVGPASIRFSSWDESTQTITTSNPPQMSCTYTLMKDKRVCTNSKTPQAIYFPLTEESLSFGATPRFFNKKGPGIGSSNQGGFANVHGPNYFEVNNDLKLYDMSNYGNSFSIPYGLFQLTSVMGNSVYRVKKFGKNGTAFFVAKPGQGNLVMTNYHVLFPHDIDPEDRRYNSASALPIAGIKGGEIQKLVEQWAKNDIFYSPQTLFMLEKTNGGNQNVYSEIQDYHYCNRFLDVCVVELKPASNGQNLEDIGPALRLNSLDDSHDTWANQVPPYAIKEKLCFMGNGEDDGVATTCGNPNWRSNSTFRLEVGSMSALHGDSGSPLFYTLGNSGAYSNHIVVGLLHAGSNSKMVAIKMTKILEDIQNVNPALYQKLNIY